MKQRCQIILQNYLKTIEYNNNYTIVRDKFINNYFKIYYKNQMLFFIYSSKQYVKYNNNKIKKQYKHNEYFYYYNKKNNNNNNEEWKYYNTFLNIYKKIIRIHLLDICFMYYYSIKKPYYIYIDIKKI